MIQKDSLQEIPVSHLTETISNNTDTPTSFWLWIALIELLIIVFLIFKLMRKKSNLDFSDLSKNNVRKAKSTAIDMDNLMDSINSSKQLYKELSRACHPDRFINSEKEKLAEEIFQDISKYKRDFKKLSQLKERAIIELEIKFK